MVLPHLWCQMRPDCVILRELMLFNEQDPNFLHFITTLLSCESFNLFCGLQVFCSPVCGHHKNNHKGRRRATTDTTSENLYWQNSHHAPFYILSAEWPDRSRSLWIEWVPTWPRRLLHHQRFREGPLCFKTPRNVIYVSDATTFLVRTFFKDLFFLSMSRSWLHKKKWPRTQCMCFLRKTPSMLILESAGRVWRTHPDPQAPSGSAWWPVEDRSVPKHSNRS